MNKFLTIASLSFIFSTYGYCKSFAFELREFGFGRSNCSGDITAVAEQFSRMSNTPILSAGCKEPSVGQLSATGEILYSSPHLIPIYSSDLRSAQLFEGHYKTFAECENARKNELNIFQTNTKLVPFVSYCYRSNAVGAPRYRANILAIGTPDSKKFTTATTWNHEPTDLALLRENVSNMLASKGANLVALSLGQSLGGIQAAADFYAAQELHLQSSNFELSWEAPQSCLQEAQQLNTSWNHDSVPAFFFCTKRPDQLFEIAQIYLSQDIVSHAEFEQRLLPQSYQSLSDCQSDLPHIRQSFEEAGVKVFATSCGAKVSGKKYQVVIISQ